MGRVLVGMAISLDGFVNDQNGDVSRLYPDLGALRQTELLQEAIQTTGAVVMGRRAYDMAQGDFTNYEFQVPIFVLTHHVPEKVAKGENEKLSFTFVTDGIESAIEQAKAAAGDKNITVIGGADTVQQCIKKGLLDEIQIGIVPILLGGGLRLFEHTDKQIDLEKMRVIGGADTVQQCIKKGLLDEIQIGIVPILLGSGLRLFEHIGKQIDLEKMRVIESPTRTDLRFRVVK